MSDTPDALATSTTLDAERPLFDVLPALRRAFPFAALGQFPTPLARVDLLASGSSASQLLAESDVWVKRDDISSPIYGGNKVRTLEALFGLALGAGRKTVVATGAYGSNHALATVLHAPRVGLRANAILFPQPLSRAAQVNLGCSAALADSVKWLPHWSSLPLAMFLAQRASARSASFVMVPGGAIPEGSLAYISAAFELALQVDQGLIPPPRSVLIAVGSTCTSAGLLLGMVLAQRFGLGWHASQGASPELPKLISVRVTPWPITSVWRIVGLARRTSELLFRVTGDRRCLVDAGELRARLEVDGRFLGRGYGRATRSGLDAIASFGAWGESALDTTYTAKSAAALLHYARDDARLPLVYWATKSSVPLPVAGLPAELPRRPQAFLAARADY